MRIIDRAGFSAPILWAWLGFTLLRLTQRVISAEWGWALVNLAGIAVIVAGLELRRLTMRRHAAQRAAR